ncbi:MAG TPA: TlpA disulfide reductase family protein [Caldimonas sp.]|nr:TlpA disulfide reductase family protein [Caldimonas sp.]HEX2540044.1 TlpA disulfide reductase family protein [Caldimonas sp.]
MAIRRASASPDGGRRGVLRAGSVALLGACGLRRAVAAHVVRPWLAGRPVPPLDLVDLDGKRWRLDALAGKVVVLNFWATWCEPCRTEMPSLEAMAARRAGSGVSVLTVNYKEPPEVIRAFLAKLPLKLPILLDPDGDATFDWTPRVFPSTVLIGRNGQPSQVVLGDLDWSGPEANALLDPLVAAPAKS